MGRGRWREAGRLCPSGEMARGQRKIRILFERWAMRAGSLSLLVIRNAVEEGMERWLTVPLEEILLHHALEITLLFRVISILLVNFVRSAICLDMSLLAVPKLSALDVRKKATYPLSVLNSSLGNMCQQCVPSKPKGKDSTISLISA